MITIDKDNVRLHPDGNKAAIKNSLSELGAGRSVLLDADDVLIAGNGVYEQAEALGIPIRVIETDGTELVAVKRTDLSTDDEKRIALAIADNRLTDLSEFDDEALNKMLDELSPDMQELAGYAVDPNDLLNEGNTDEDEVPEVTEATCKLGELWILGNHRLLCGDSTDKEQVEKLMDGEKADMVFTDPPYGVDYDGIKNDDRKGLESLLRGVFSNYLATSKSGASIYVFHSDRCADIFHKVFREFFHFSSMVIWSKNSLTLSQTDYQSQHEPCLYGWMDNGSHSWYSDRKQTSVWYCNKERVEGHTTPKPIEIIERGVNNSSKGGDLITDLFLGSGSTLIACEKTNRKCYGMELDEHYCDVIIKRWEDYTGETAVKHAI
jgi:DNA modification methylase